MLHLFVSRTHVQPTHAGHERTSQASKRTRLFLPLSASTRIPSAPTGQLHVPFQHGPAEMQSHAGDSRPMFSQRDPTHVTHYFTITHAGSMTFASTCSFPRMDLFATLCISKAAKVQVFFQQASPHALFWCTAILSYKDLTPRGIIFFRPPALLHAYHQLSTSSSLSRPLIPTFS